MTDSFFRQLASFVFLVLLFSSHTSFASGNNGKAEVAFSQGLLSYHQKNYPQAEKSFATALQLNPQHAAAAFFAGLSSFNQDHDKDALVFFNKAIALNPNDAQPYLYRGILEYRLGKNKDAKEDFQKTVNLAPKGASKPLAESYLRKLTGKPAAGAASASGGDDKPWSVYGSVTTQYDSNVSLNPENLSLATLPSDQNDFGWTLQAGGSYRLFKKTHTRLLIDASYTQSLYAELDSFNYGTAHGGLTFQWSNNKWSAQFPAAYEFSLLASSAYLHSLPVRPQVNYAPVSWLLLSLITSGAYNDFIPSVTTDAQNRDAFNLLPEFGAYFFFNKKQTCFLKAGYAYEQNLASGDDWDYKAHWIKALFSVPLMWKLSLAATADILVDKPFINVDSVIGTRRDDSGVTLGAYLSRPLTKVLTGQFNYSYSQNDSNQALFESKRHVVGVTLSASY